MESYANHACIEIENNSFLIVTMVTDVDCNDDYEVAQYGSHASNKHLPT